MKRTFQLFWQRAWDNLVHLVIVNLVWFTLSLPFLFGLGMLIMVMGSDAAPAGESAEAVSSGESAGDEDGGAQSADDEEELSERGAVGAVENAATESPLETLERTAREKMAVHRRRLVFVLVYLSFCWVLFCIATGYVFYAMADLVAEYDFSGYRYVARRFLRKGPVLRSVAAVTLCAVTLVASIANLFFYLYLAAVKGLVFFLLAGIMAWFVLFAVMTFALALPLVAQRDMRLPGALKTGAILALSAPLRTFFVLLMAGVVALIAILSLAGFGFLVMSAPAVLFNAEVRARLEEIEGSTVPPSPRDEAPE